MKKTNRKGFTIVELVIVIAVIAILAAVLIPTFSSLIKKANISNDIMLAKNLDTALATSSIQGKPQNMTEVVDALDKQGFDIRKLNPTTNGYYFAWDSKNNQIVLLSDEYEIVYANIADPVAIDCYVAVSTAEEAKSISDEDYSLWFINDVETVELSKFVNVDSGLSKVTNLSITEERDSTIVLKGTYKTVTVNNSLGSVKQFGIISNMLNIQSIKPGTFEVNGAVSQVSISSGIVKIAAGATAAKVVVPSGAATNVEVVNNGTVTNVEVNAKSKVNNDGQINNVVVNASEVVLDNSAKIDKVEVNSGDVSGNNTGVIVDSPATITNNGIMNDEVSATVANREALETQIANKIDNATSVKNVFASGTGTSNNPFLIATADLLEAVDIYMYHHSTDSQEALANPKYYKIVADIDFSGRARLNFYGNIDGNGKRIKVTDALFNKFGYPVELGGELNTIKNLTVEADICSTKSNSALIRTCGSYVTLDSVYVTGKMICAGGSPFITFGANNFGLGESEMVLNITNCKSDLTIINTTDCVAGFIKHPYCIYASSTININNSDYTGSVRSVNDNVKKYFNNAWQTKCYVDGTQVNINDTINSYSVALLQTFTATAGEKGSYISFKKLEGADHATVALFIAPNDKNDFGAYLSCYENETIDLSEGNAGEDFSSLIIKNFNITINGAGEEGINGDTYNVVDDFFRTTYYSSDVSIVQYDENNNVIGVLNVNIKEPSA